MYIEKFRNQKSICIFRRYYSSVFGGSTNIYEFVFATVKNVIVTFKLHHHSKSTFVATAHFFIPNWLQLSHFPKARWDFLTNSKCIHCNSVKTNINFGWMFSIFRANSREQLEVRKNKKKSQCPNNGSQRTIYFQVLAKTAAESVA